THHPARTSRGLRELFQLPRPPGERRDIPRQRPRRRCHPARRRPAPGSRLKPSPDRAGQAQRIGQQPHRLLLPRGHHPSLQTAHPPPPRPPSPTPPHLRQPPPPPQPPHQAPDPARRPTPSPPPRRRRPTATSPAPPDQPRHHRPGRRFLRVVLHVQQAATL